MNRDLSQVSTRQLRLVWMLLDGTLDLDALIEELSGIFGLPAGLRPDVETAIAGFATQALLAEGTSAAERR